MKVLPLLLASLFFVACDTRKSSTGSSAAGDDAAESTATPKPKPATPKPTPKQGEWMLKNYKNPLDQKR